MAAAWHLGATLVAVNTPFADDDYRAINRRNWDERAVAHARSAGYGIDRLLADPSALSDVVSFDLPRLGRLDGLDVLHLQCHIGTDTLSLARLGARSVTGLDLSPASLAEARALADAAGVDIRYVESDVYSAVEALGSTYDLVYTGVGALNWLPSIERWAEVVAHLLRPGGRLFVRDGHPMMYTLPDLEHFEVLQMELPYFEVDAPLVTDSEWTYVSTDQPLQNTTNVEWNHGLGETVMAVIGRGFRVVLLEEHRSVPWEAVPGLMRARPDGEWELIERPERLPLSFTLHAVKE